MSGETSSAALFRAWLDAEARRAAVEQAFNRARWRPWSRERLRRVRAAARLEAAAACDAYLAAIPLERRRGVLNGMAAVRRGMA